ncbi:hypothetical protein A3E66_05600 [Candidatus Daviesbacteria bacterium RIFCSPHIGHO2_12_FULL_37_16]|uniref:DUF6922 domain-containing protein n=3 Tax=Candidatus Daviesiibacteriota TaxID=1752718 RepID=A0A0G0EWD3_9BACT|nr:MAG: hypothetical protein US19_C0010G0028 [Candidatus Daviesbacteria bacterium GW2011_GWB1_36_5]KKQ16008.1 MAG: hypothetical protein US28_C0006G0003 [Candidatus Daviesbacteria bacterium GW2011_GWA1_36_8]OGE36343.1 MAG: hypothetical protein A3E66_05600 [Candidatus Daviesbacteria bacterium RIFCSPHIGHO2_12_FULL_37_16]
MVQLPQSVKATLWSYDATQIDLQKHKKIIISQVLNFGSLEAVRWLFANYSSDDIKEVTINIPLGAWDKKSLNLWSLYFNLNKGQFQNRFI